MESRSFTVITILFTALFCVSVVCPEEVLSIPTEFTLPQMRQQMKAKRKYKLVSNRDLHLVFFFADLDTFLFILIYQLSVHKLPVVSFGQMHCFSLRILAITASACIPHPLQIDFPHFKQIAL